MSEIEEIAKTANNALDKAEKFGGFISKYIDASLVQAMGIIEDKLKYRRWENQLKLMKKSNDLIKKLGYEKPPKELSLKYGLPLLEASSLEDDDKLQELWANLLVNSTINENFTLERSYISVLEQLSKLEAKIIIDIYSKINYEKDTTYRIDVSNYPDIEIIKNESIIPSQEDINKIANDIFNGKENNLNSKDELISYEMTDVNLALSNLIRLNCLRRVITFGGGENFRSVHPTIFGAKLYEAVKDPIK